MGNYDKHVTLLNCGHDIDPTSRKSGKLLIGSTSPNYNRSPLTAIGGQTNEIVGLIGGFH